MACSIRLLAAAAVVAVMLLPSTATAAPPTLNSAGQQNRHITASWSFAPGNYASRAIEVSGSRFTEDTGFFIDRDQEGFFSLPAAARSWRSGRTFSPGAHFVHVLVENLDCPPSDLTCNTLEWSNIGKVVIPMPKPSPPSNFSAGREGGRVTARWTLPKGRYTAGLIEVSKRKRTNAGGQFRRSVAYQFLDRRVTRWKSGFLGPGTYYVHVSSELNICGEDGTEGCGRYGWSRIDRVVIPRSEGRRHFKGRTSQGRRIRFTVFQDRVTGIWISCRFSSWRGTRSGSATLGSTGLGAGGVFSDHDEWLFTDGSSGDSWIRGNLRGPYRATGTFRFKTRGGFNGGCSTGRVRWSARA